MFAPAVSGDFSDGPTGLRSLYSASLRRCFWVALDSVLPQFVRLPRGLLRGVHAKQVDLELVLDIYLLSNEQALLQDYAYEYTFPLVSVLDDSGDELLLVWHSVSVDDSQGFKLGHQFDINITGAHGDSLVIPSTDLTRPSASTTYALNLRWLQIGHGVWGLGFGVWGLGCWV